MQEDPALPQQPAPPLETSPAHTPEVAVGTSVIPPTPLAVAPPTPINSVPTASEQIPVPQETATGPRVIMPEYTALNDPSTLPANQSPQVSPTQGPMSASQLGLTYPKSAFNSKKLIVKSVVMFVLLAIVAAALVFTNVIPLSRFKTVTYDNGKGASFSLKFYSRHTTGVVASSGLTQLVSKVSVDGNFPLVFWAEANDNSKSPSFSQNNCTLNHLTKAFDARMEYVNGDVPVCGLTAKDIDYAYIVTLHDKDHGYLIYIAQDIDFKKLVQNSQSAKDGLAKTGLNPYQRDVKTILSSFKPINQ